MKITAALLFAFITFIAGVYIGYTCKDGINTDILLAVVMFGNALLTISTIKSNNK